MMDSTIWLHLISIERHWCEVQEDVIETCPNSQGQYVLAMHNGTNNSVVIRLPGEMRSCMKENKSSLGYAGRIKRCRL